MDKEINKNPGEWTIDTLKDHLINMIQNNDKRYEERFAQSEKAVATALTSNEKAIAAAFAATEKAITAAFAANEKAVSAAFISQGDSVKKAEQAQKDTNIQNNEFRGQLKDQAQTFLPRIEFDNRLKSSDEKTYALVAVVETKINTMEKTVEAIENKGAGKNQMWGYIVGALGILAIIYSFLKQSGTVK